MSSLKNIRIGGVPEHFNLPWHLGMEHDHFKKHGVRLEWQTFKGGTGQMTKALRNDEVDVCILLTEGIVADIANGNPSKIIGPYVNTPLIWGIHTGVNNSLERYGEIYDKRYAISRIGSGSHLMPLVDAFSKAKPLNEDQFVIIKNLDGALESLAKNDSDVFYWEKFTTKPYVDEGKLRRVGEYITPWPCFQIAASDKIIKEHPDALRAVLKSIYFITDQFMNSLDAVEQVAARYELELEDAEQWFFCTEWSTSSKVSKKMIQNVIFTLKEAGIIHHKPSFEDLVVDVMETSE